MAAHPQILPAALRAGCALGDPPSLFPDPPSPPSPTPSSFFLPVPPYVGGQNRGTNPAWEEIKCRILNPWWF